jgi:hypothetical protein
MKIKKLSRKFMMTTPHEGLKRKGWDISGEDLYLKENVIIGKSNTRKHVLVTKG